MRTEPEITVIVSTFERPWHLERCLHSLARQRGVEGRFEVVVSDDGSRDHTAEMVDRFATTAPFPLRFVSQPQEGFRLARSRNNGVRAATAPYLLFTDGDCLLPADHLKIHLAARRPRVVQAGDCLRIDKAASEGIDLASVERGDFPARATFRARQRMWRTAIKAIFYQSMDHALRPKLVGANIGVWRDDFERINGFDDAFVGWGCEDDDFARRLRRSGVRVRSILHRTVAYHLWHPPHATAPKTWSEGANTHRLTSTSQLTECLVGLRRRDIRDLAVRVVNHRCRWIHWAWPNGGGAKSARRCEVELLLLPGEGDFVGDGDFRVVIAPEGMVVPARIAQQAHSIVRTPHVIRTPDELYQRLGVAIAKAA